MKNKGKNIAASDSQRDVNIEIEIMYPNLMYVYEHIVDITQLFARSRDCGNAIERRLELGSYSSRGKLVSNSLVYIYR